MNIVSIHQNSARGAVEKEGQRQLGLSDQYRIDLVRDSFDAGLEYLVSDIENNTELSDAEKWRELRRSMGQSERVTLPDHLSLVGMLPRDTSDYLHCTFGLVDFSKVTS